MRSIYFPVDFENLLPCDGIVYYVPAVFDKKECDCFQNALLKNIVWENDRVTIFGKTIITKRKVAWYGDKPYSYTYSKHQKTALFWSEELSAIKSRIEKTFNASFNSCLLNLYHDGEEGMSWHSDDEPELLKKGTIASVSFGAERKFVFKHKMSGIKKELLLENGSLLLMLGGTQENWLHQLPKTKKCKDNRINLTFRTIITS